MPLVFLELMSLFIVETTPDFKNRLHDRFGRAWPYLLLIYSGLILVSSLLCHVDDRYVRIYMIAPIIITLCEYDAAYHHRTSVFYHLVNLSLLLVITLLLAFLLQMLFAVPVIFSFLGLFPCTLIVSQRKELLAWLSRK